MEYSTSKLASTTDDNDNGRDPLEIVPPAQRAAEDSPVAEGLWLLWGKRRFLAGAVVIAAVGSLIVALLIPSRYSATTALMPPDSQSGSGMLAALLSKGGPGLGLLGSDLLGLKSSSAVFQSVLRSRTVEDRIVNRFDLRQVYGEKLFQATRKRLEEETEITEDRKSGIITITVNDRDPKRAAAIANAYVEELGRLVAELDTSSAHRERVFLEERLKSVKQELDTAARDFSEFSSKNMAIDIKEQGKAMVEAAATLQGELIAAQSEEESLRQVYTDSNVRIRSLQARVAELKQQLEKLGGKGETSVSDSTSPNDDLYPSIKKLPLLGVTYADLYGRVKVEETVYELLTQQYELAKVQEAKEIPSVRVLDTAVVPERRSGPKRLQILLSGVLLCLFGAVGWVLVAENWKQVRADNSFKSLAREIAATGWNRARTVNVSLKQKLWPKA